MNDLWLVAMHVAVIGSASASVILVEVLLRAARLFGGSADRAAGQSAWQLRWPQWLQAVPGDCRTAVQSGADRSFAPLAASPRQAAALPTMPGRTAPWQRLAEVAGRPEIHQLHSPRRLPGDG